MPNSRRRVSRTPINLRHFLKTILFFFIFVFIGCLVFVLTSFIFYTKLDRFAVVAYGEEGGEVNVTNFDFVHQEITTYAFPDDTIIDVSNNLGEWKIQNVVKLASIEKVEGGKLLAQSITKHFRMPVNNWYQGKFSNIIEGSFLQKIIFLTPSRKNNLSYKERLSIVLSLLENKENKVVKLEETSYLKSVSLKDGTKGYIRTDPAPQRVLAEFSDSSIVDENMKLIIKNGSGSFSRAKQFSEVLEVTGFIIVAIDEIPVVETGCEIAVRNPDLFENILKNYECNFEKKVDLADDEIQITIGKNFVF